MRTVDLDTDCVIFFFFQCGKLHQPGGGDWTCNTYVGQVTKTQCSSNLFSKLFFAVVDSASRRTTKLIS